MHDKEYLVHVGRKSYAEALAYCKTKGGKLVEPKSAQANNDIVDLAKAIETQGNGVWIGINDKSKEGKFIYASDGKSLKYTNWNPGQSDDSTSDDSKSDDSKSDDSETEPVNSESDDSESVESESDDSGNNEDCGILWNKAELKWKAVPCSEKNSFICERHPGKHNH